MGFWQRVIVNTLMFFIISTFLPNVFHVSSIWIAIAASVILAILNMLIKPILVVLSFPITILTFGLFGIVINALMLQTTSWVVGHNFIFSSFGASMIVAILLSVVNGLITRNMDR